MTFKVLHRKAPKFIVDLFHWYSPVRPLRSSLTTSLVPNRNQTIRYGKKLIDTSTAALQNSVPNEIKCATNKIQFKKLITLHMALCYSVPNYLPFINIHVFYIAYHMFLIILHTYISFKHLHCFTITMSSTYIFFPSTMRYI